MTFHEYMNEKRMAVEAYLEKLLPVDSHIPVITDAMRYSLFAGGKRLRSILSIMSCELFDGEIDEIMPFACCIELIHTYSLIHDDLPAMDNDDLRRGRPTNHKVYGDGFAVLAGDALLNYAFEMMLSIIEKKPLPKYIKAAGIISRAAGKDGMIGGQSIDLYYEDKKIDLNKLKEMHHLKTGALISASLTTGAVLSDAKDKDVEAIDNFGKLIGLAFQITDDILDVEGTKENLGKTIGKDCNSHKATFVTLNGLEASKRVAKELINEAKALIDVYGEKAASLKLLADYILERSS